MMEFLSPLTFFYLTLFLHGIGLSLFLIFFVKGKEDFYGPHKQWIGVSTLAGLFFMILRTEVSGYPPLVNLFEITFFYGWMINASYYFLIKKDLPKVIHLTALIIISLLFTWTIFMDKNIYPLNPQLESYWLAIHVPSAILSYSAFALSFAISLYYLIAEKMKWPLGCIDGLNFWLTFGGVFLLGFCIVTGAIWAKTAWGNYWSWDPKETWALVTFIIYFCAIVVRKVFCLKPTWHALLSVCGFMAMLFTFWGVSLFSASHHAY